MLTTYIESFIASRQELEPIFILHAKEISEHVKRGYNLAPDWKKYQRLEEAGELIFISLRNQGELIGYMTAFIAPALHYKGCLQVAQDLIYVIPSYRGNQNGQYGGDMLILKMKQEARKRGAKLVTAGYKIKRAKHMRNLLERNEFEDFENHMVCWL